PVYLLFVLSFFTATPHPPCAPLFPYTTLFRSVRAAAAGDRRRRRCRPRLDPEWARRDAHRAVPRVRPRRHRRGHRVRHRDGQREDRKSTRLNSSHRTISYAVFCLKKKKKIT